jgi:hypothetical protein
MKNLALIVALLAGTALLPSSADALHRRSNGRPSGAARTPCDETASRAAFGAFLTAFNRGDAAALDGLFAPAPEFGWYASSPPNGRVQQASRNRATLAAYFHSRHASGEKLGLVKFNYASAQPRSGATVANFNGILTRRAADVPIRKRGFKAALRCTDTERLFVVVSIGTPL